SVSATVSGATAGAVRPGPVPAAHAAADAAAADRAAAGGRPAGHGPGRSPRAAYPPPLWGWRKSPGGKAATTRRSARLPRRRSRAEISSIVARRLDVAATASDV